MAIVIVTVGNSGVAPSSSMAIVSWQSPQPLQTFTWSMACYPTYYVADSWGRSYFVGDYHLPGTKQFSCATILVFFKEDVASFWIFCDQTHATLSKKCTPNPWLSGPIRGSMATISSFFVDILKKMESIWFFFLDTTFDLKSPVPLISDSLLGNLCA